MLIAYLPHPYKPGVLLMDIGKQNSPRCDVAKRGVPSGTFLFAKKMNKNEKITPDAPENKDGLIQIIEMGKPIRNKWVNSDNTSLMTKICKHL